MKGDWSVQALEAGLARATQVFEGMTGLSFQISAPACRLMELEALPELAGNSEQAMVAVYTRLSGDTPGHAIFLFQPPAAKFLADMMVGPDESTALQESALCELCNVAGSAVLNMVADAGEIELVPSPPLVVSDMTGAVLQSVAAVLATLSQVHVIDAIISIGGEGFSARLLMVPEDRFTVRSEGVPVA